GRARYLGGEVVLSWAPARERILLSGRVDALWEHPDGTVEARDYKTGVVPGDLRGDFAAGAYALLVAARRPRPPRIVVSYERLTGQPAVVSVVVDRQLLAGALDAVRSFAAHLRAERAYAAAPSPPVCRMCPYAGTCPDSRVSR
ncbi:MAG: PD-(D/E)XK nuclease family protein, partial [Actinomycetota bacterium]|nr:PD-(D/E)XK nuclease family protein [Actinomycetota bacterium]